MKASGVQVRAVFLGAPGAGKGTQAKKLSAKTKMLHISTGDMLREQVAQKTELGSQAKGFMDQGKLVPDSLMIAMVADRIQKPDASRAWILDGFPRTLPQAKSLDQVLAPAGRQAQNAPSLTHVVQFDVPAAVLVQRLSGRWTCSKCGEIWNTAFKPPSQPGLCDSCGGALTQRADDRPEAVQQRLEVYRSETEPLLDYYRSQGILLEIDANRPPEQVFEDLLQLLTISCAKQNGQGC